MPAKRSERMREIRGRSGQSSWPCVELTIWKIGRTVGADVSSRHHRSCDAMAMRCDATNTSIIAKAKAQRRRNGCCGHGLRVPELKRASGMGNPGDVRGKKVSEVFAALLFSFCSLSLLNLRYGLKDVSLPLSLFLALFHGRI